MSNWLRIEGRPDEPLIPEVGPFYERGYSGNCLPASVKRSFRLTEDLGKMGTSNTRFLRLAHKDTGATYLLRKIFTYTDQYPMMYPDAPEVPFGRIAPTYEHSTPGFRIKQYPNYRFESVPGLSSTISSVFPITFPFPAFKPRIVAPSDYPSSSTSPSNSPEVRYASVAPSYYPSSSAHSTPSPDVKTGACVFAVLSLVYFCTFSPGFLAFILALAVLAHYQLRSIS